MDPMAIVAFAVTPFLVLIAFGCLMWMTENDGSRERREQIRKLDREIRAICERDNA